MGSIFKQHNKRTGWEGQTWYIKYYRNGKPYVESTKSTKKGDAERLLKMREGQIVEGRFPGLKVEKTTFNDMAEDYLSDYRANKRKSTVHAEIRVRHLKEHFGTMRANEIGTGSVKAYIEKRQKEGAENATINRELTSLVRMFSLAVESGKVLRALHISKLDENNVREGFFEPLDFEKIKEALPSHLKPLFVTAYFTGLRKGELQNMTWNQLDLFGRKITLPPGQTKNKEARVILLVDGELYDTLLTQYKETSSHYPNCPYVFHKDGRQIGDFRKVWERTLLDCGYRPTFKCRECGSVVEIEPSQRWKWEPPKVYIEDDGTWKEMICARCKKSRFKRWGRVFHDNRRTAVRNYLRTGTGEKVAMELSGHRTRSIFERYNITSETDKRRAQERLSRAHEEQKRQMQDGHNSDIITLVK